MSSDIADYFATTGGHGISIGSVGGRSDNDVANVYIANSKISDSDNGVRIKTVSGATGSVTNVTYTGITLSNIAKYGIVIEQDYENGSPTGTPTSGVPITDITISNIAGSVVTKAVPVYILCASCSDWVSLLLPLTSEHRHRMVRSLMGSQTWSSVAITGGTTSTECTGIPSGASC